MPEGANDPTRPRLEYLVRKALQEDPPARSTSFNSVPNRIYILSDELIAKSVDSYRSASNEYSFGRFAYEQGVSVPKIHGYIPPDNVLNMIGPIESWFIIMDYIKGENLADLSGKERKDAIRQYRRELRNVVNLGIFPGDSGFLGNAIYSNNRKLYLVDFELWKYGSDEELRRVYDAISTPLPKGYNLDVYDWE